MRGEKVKYFPKQPKTALTKLTKPKKSHFFSGKQPETTLTKLTKPKSEGRK